MDEFILRILVELLDNASPGLEKLAAQIEALKRAGGTQQDHPTAAVSRGLDDTARAARDAEASTRRHREETDRSTTSQRAHGQATSASKRSLDEYSRSAKDAADAQQKLAEKGRGLLQMVDELNRSMQGQRTMSQQQRLDAQRLSVELQNLSRAYKATSDGARLFSGESDKLRQSLAADQERVRQDIALKSQQVEAINRVAQAQQKATDAEIKAARDAASAHKAEQQSISDLISRYQAFHKAISDGDVSRKDAVRGLQDFGRELRSLSRDFEAGSKEALLFGRMADQAVKQSKESIPDATSAVERLANRFDDWGLKVVSLSAKLRGLALAAVVGLAQQLDSAIVGLVGSLISVGSAAAMAAAGIGGALVSAIGQAIPAITVFVGVLERLKLVFQAVQAQSQLQQQQFTNTAQAAASAASAHSALINAQNNLKNSYVSLADAQDRVKQAQLGLTDARIQAQRQLVDLVLAEKSAQLAALGASLSLQQAQQQLQQTVLTGGVGTTLESAQLQVAQAQLGVQQAAVNVPRSSYDAQRALDLGISGAPGVVGAAQSLRSAHAGVGQARSQITSAQLAVQQAHLQAQTAAATAAPAQQQLDFLLGRMDATERRLFDTISKLVNLFRGPNTPLSRATDSIIKPFADAIDKIYAILSNAKNPVTRALNDLGTAVGRSLGTLEKTLFSKQGMNFFRTMAEDAAKNLPVIIDSFGHIAKIFMDIAKAAQPVLKFLVDGFNQWISGVDKSMSGKSGMDKLQDFFKSTIPYIRSFLDLGKALFDLFGSIIDKAAPAGKSIIDSFTNSIQSATQWVNQHGPEVRQFFQQAAQVLSTLGELVFQIAKAMVGLFDPGTVKTFVTFITTYLLPALSDALKVLGFVTDTVMSFFNLFGAPGRKALEFFAAATAALLIFGKAFDPVRKAASGLFGMIGRIGAALEALKGGQGLKGALSALTSKGTGGVAGSIEEAGKVAGTTIGTSMKEAGASVAEDIRAAMATGGTEAASEIEVAEATGGTAAASEIAAGEATGGLTAAGEVGTAEATGGLTAGGAGLLGGGALASAGTVGILGVGAVAAGIGIGHLLPGSDVHALPGARYAGYSETLVGRQGGDPHYQQAQTQAQTSRYLEALQKQLKGVSDPTDLSTAAVMRLHGQIEKFLNMPDITASQRSSLQKLATAFDPVKVAMDKAQKEWTATFQGISATTGNVMQQVMSVLKTDIANINTNLGTGTKQGAQAMASTITAAYNTVLTNTSKTGKGVQQGLAAIGKMLNDALKAVGATGPGQQISLDTFAHLSSGIQTGLLSGSLTAGGVESTHATGGYEQPKSGGKIIQVAEGGYPEVVLTTDPKYAGRQRGLLARYLQEAPHVLDGGYASGGYVFPFPKGEAFSWQRVDQGQDLQGPPGGPVLAIAPGTISQASDRYGGFGPYYATEQITAGPLAGRGVYYGHTKITRTGRVNAGQQIAVTQPRADDWTAAPAGWLELGFLPYGSMSAGAAIAPLLHHLAGDRVSGAVAASINAPNIHGHGVVGKIGQGGIDRVTKFANAYLQSVTGLTGASSTAGNFGTSGGATQTGAIPSDLQQYNKQYPKHYTGQPGYALSPTVAAKIFEWAGMPGWTMERISQHESTLQPGIVQAGQPYATTGWGLLQITAGNSVPDVGVNEQLLNPLINSRASASKYRAGRLGPWAADAGIAGNPNDHYTGKLAAGGFIAAADGFSGVVDNPTMFLAGEAGKEHVQITPAQQGGYFSADAQFASSPAVQALSQALSSADPANSISGIFNLWKIIKQGFAALSGISIKSDKFAKNYIPFVNSLLTQDTGLFDRLSNGFNVLDTMFQAAQVIGGRLASIGMPAGMRKIIEHAFGKAPEYSVSKSGVVSQQMSPTQQATLDLSGLRDEHTYLMGERDIVGTALTSVTRRMNAAQAAVAKDPKNKRLQTALTQLVTEHNNLITRMQALTGQIAQNVSGIFSAEQNRINNAIQDIQTRFDIGVSSAKGPGAISKAGTRGVAGLEAQLKYAIKIGDKALQDSITQDITSMFESTASALDTYWQQGAGALSTNSLQRSGSFIQNVIAKMAPSSGGGAIAAAQATLGLAGVTQTSLQDQIGSYTGLLAAANKSGNKAAIDMLTDKIAGLQETLAENTQAIADDTVAVRQAAIDRITAQTQFQTGVLGALYGAVQTIGQLTGGLDVSTALGITRANQNVLQGSTGQLLGQLKGSTGIDFTGLSGTSLIQAIAGLPVQQLEQGMSQSQQTQFEGLITSIVSNISALEQNTVQLQTLNGQLQGPQTFSTTAWQTFRSAIFTGMGGLLPQYSSIPSLQGGGEIISDGLAMLHAAEVVHHKGAVSGDTHIHASITSPTEVADPVHFGRAAAWAYKVST